MTLPLILSIIILIFLIIVAIFLITGLTGAPYVPTLKDGLDKVFTELYPASKKDLIIDLGSGSGTVLKAISDTSARALGIELNPVLALITALKFRHDKNVRVKCRNFYAYHFPKETTVVYAFAVSLHINAIYRKISAEAARLNKTLYFISNAFNVPGVKPVKKVGTFYLYKIEPKATLKKS